MACERQRVICEIYVVYVKIQKRGLTWKGIFEDKINAETQGHRRCDSRKYKQLAAFFFFFMKNAFHMPLPLMSTS